MPPRKKIPQKSKGIRKLKRYKKQQCAAMVVDKETGERHRCKRNAVGKSTLCQAHNKNVIASEALIESTLETHAISTYNPVKHPLEFIKLSQMGSSPVEVAASIGISYATLLKWSQKYPEFNTAAEIAKAAYESYWLQKGKDNLNSRSFNTSLFKFLTGNTLGYSDKVESKSFNMNVSGVLAVPNAPESDEAWEDAIKNGPVIDIES